jgi:hypothetical protein
MVRWAFVACVGVTWPAIAWGAAPLPLAGLRAQPEPVGDAVEGLPPEPTSSKAPEDAPPPPPEDATTTEAEPATPPGDPDPTLKLDEERDKSPRRRDFNRHGVGVRGGIVVVPTWVLSKWVETQTNALCRGDTVGNFARERGLLKTQGCNFYVGGEYVYRQSRILDIVGSIGYMHAHLPEGFWLDKGKYDGSSASLSAADYTEVKLGMMYFEADFIARAPIVVTDDVELGLGGGAGVGLGILFGGVWQTAIGADPDGYVPGQGPTMGDTCSNPKDLADFRRCTPRYDPQEDNRAVQLQPGDDGLTEPNPDNYASCSANNCSENDLKRFGYRQKNGSIPPVIPVVNLILSARIIVKDVFGITINGGFNTGFYFGGAMTYFFGKEFQKARGDDGKAAPGGSTGKPVKKEYYDPYEPQPPS